MNKEKEDILKNLSKHSNAPLEMFIDSMYHALCDFGYANVKKGTRLKYAKEHAADFKRRCGLIKNSHEHYDSVYFWNDEMVKFISEDISLRCKIRRFLDE